jgi:hypothetical protein
VAPLLEVGHIWVVVAVWGWVPADLVVVHLVGDQARDRVWLSSGTNVLTIASSTGGTARMLASRFRRRLGFDLRVVGIDARSGNLGSNAGHIVGPGQRRG